MGKGDRATVRWAKARRKNKQARLRRRADERGAARQAGASKTAARKTRTT